MHDSSMKDNDTPLEFIPIVSPKTIWTIADNNGWHNPQADLATDLLLIHSEVSEATEALRIDNIKGNHGVAEELADVIIRVFHTAQKNGIDIVQEVYRKCEVNAARPHRHGGKKF